MSKCIVYDAAGNILRTVTCPKSMTRLQAQDNENILEILGDVSDVDDIVVSGAIRRRPDTEMEARRAQLAGLDMDKEIAIRRKEADILRRLAIAEIDSEGVSK